MADMRMYGDVMTSDDALREMLRDRKDHLYVAKKVREVRCRKMSKSAFARWKANAALIGDDEPLSKFV